MKSGQQMQYEDHCDAPEDWPERAVGNALMYRGENYTRYGQPSHGNTQRNPQPIDQENADDNAGTEEEGKTV